MLLIGNAYFSKEMNAARKMILNKVFEPERQNHTHV